MTDGAPVPASPRQGALPQKEVRRQEKSRSLASLDFTPLGRSPLDRSRDRRDKRDKPSGMTRPLLRFAYAS